MDVRPFAIKRMNPAFGGGIFGMAFFKRQSRLASGLLPGTVMPRRVSRRRAPGLGGTDEFAFLWRHKRRRTAEHLRCPGAAPDHSSFHSGRPVFSGGRSALETSACPR